MIEASLLSMAPIGSQKEEVLRALDGKGWGPVRAKKGGFLKQEPPRPMEIIGVASIAVHLGDYGFFRTSVDAFWGFDEKGKLIDVWVWKTTDAP